MSSPACEERGADLFLLARDGGEPGAELAPHLASCPACAADLALLRSLARDLHAAHAGLAPRPATRAAVLRAAAESAVLDEAPPPRPPGSGKFFTLWAPLGAIAASALITVFVLSRGPGRPVVEAPGVVVRPVFGKAAVEGMEEGGTQREAILSADATASVHLGSGFDVEVVLGPGARLQVPGPGSHGLLTLLAGAAYFERAPRSGGPGFDVSAGGVGLSGDGACFALERRSGGLVSVTVASGALRISSGGAERTVTGPCRVEIADGQNPPEPSPAEPSDATGWFAYPELSLEVAAPAAGAAEEIVLTLRPSVPRVLRIAPFHRFDTLFTLRAQREDRGLVTIPVTAKMLRRAPLEPDADGAFLLGPDRPYRVVVDPALLGLAPGTWRVEALYTATRVGGLWRGTRPSNPVDLVIR